MSARTIVVILLAIAVPLAAGCSTCAEGGAPLGVDGAAQTDAEPVRCDDDATRCEAGVYQLCVLGAWTDVETCTAECEPSLGCVECLPGTGTCNGDVSTACLSDGSGTQDVLCDPVQGMSCDDAGSGLCVGACAPDQIGDSYVGCDYYATVTGNIVDSNFLFAVIISNAGQTSADVTIEGGAEPTPIALTVPAGQLVVQPLAWQEDLKACTSFGQAACGLTATTSVIAPGGAYRIRTTAPVTAYQFSPLEYQNGAQFSITNDASLLLPTNTYGDDYVVASYADWDVQGSANPGLLAITSAADGVQVTVTTTAPVDVSADLPAFAAGVPQTFSLDRGDVAELFTYAGDLTGTRVSATGPIAVVGGHYCTEVPDGTNACDHLEESMFPVRALSTRYLVSAPAVPTIPSGKVRVVRVIATEDNTALTYDPPQSAAQTIANAGEFVELAATADSFEIASDRRVLVAEYMSGQGAGGDSGDPAMALAVPVDQFRTDYLFHAPLSYESNFVNVVAKAGTTVTLDGAAVPGFAAIGGTGYAVARVALGDGSAGTHTISSAEPFGITVYGYGQFTSYWYPGGLDLAEIPID